MDDHLEAAKIVPLPQAGALVTSRLFEAYLACPTKCHLQSKGEAATGNAYTTWALSRSESYCREGVQRLTASHLQKFSRRPVEKTPWKNASWHFAPVAT
jgi:hypothetical protein